MHRRLQGRTFSCEGIQGNSGITQLDERSSVALQATSCHQNVLGTDISMNQLFSLLEIKKNIDKLEEYYMFQCC